MLKKIIVCGLALLLFVPSLAATAADYNYDTRDVVVEKELFFDAKGLHVDVAGIHRDIEGMLYEAIYQAKREKRRNTLYTAEIEPAYASCRENTSKARQACWDEAFTEIFGKHFDSAYRQAVADAHAAMLKEAREQSYDEVEYLAKQDMNDMARRSGIRQVLETYVLQEARSENPEDNYLMLQGALEAIPFGEEHKYVAELRPLAEISSRRTSRTIRLPATGEDYVVQDISLIGRYRVKVKKEKLISDLMGRRLLKSVQSYSDYKILVLPRWPDLATDFQMDEEGNVVRDEVDLKFRKMLTELGFPAPIVTVLTKETLEYRMFTSFKEAFVGSIEADFLSSDDVSGKVVPIIRKRLKSKAPKVQDIGEALREAFVGLMREGSMGNVDNRIKQQIMKTIDNTNSDQQKVIAILLNIAVAYEPGSRKARITVTGESFMYHSKECRMLDLNARGSAKTEGVTTDLESLVGETATDLGNELKPLLRLQIPVMAERIASWKSPKTGGDKWTLIISDLSESDVQAIKEMLSELRGVKQVEPSRGSQVVFAVDGDMDMEGFLEEEIKGACLDLLGIDAQATADHAAKTILVQGL